MNVTLVHIAQFDLSGKHWTNRMVLKRHVWNTQKVVESMRSALTAELKAAICTYEAKPRTQWIFDSSVQSTIVASRLFFTADVSAAFDDLEEGNEDALKVIVHCCDSLLK